MRPTRPGWLGYGFAVLAAVLSVAVTFELWPVGPGRLITLVAAVAISAWYGGVGPGIVAALLSAIGAGMFLLSPDPAASIVRVYGVPLGAFTCISTLVILLTEERRRAEARERSHREWLEVTLASIGDGVITTIAAGEVAFMNMVAESLTGWKPAEAHGRPLASVLNVVDGESRRVVEDPAARILSGGAPGENAMPLVLIARDGKETPIDCNSAPIRDTGGEIGGVILVFRDISERKRSEEALARREKHFRALIENSSDAVILIDRAGKILHASGSLERVLGYRAGEILGRSALSIVHPDQLELLRRRLDELLAAKVPLENEALVRHKDGSWRWVESLATNLLDDPAVGAVVVNFRDISERKRAEKEREESLGRERAARAQAEEASRLKEEFLATVSHELRTPLNAVLGWAQMLRSRTLDPMTSARAVETIERSALAQARLINDILDVSSITTGNLRLDLGLVDLSALVSETIDAMRPAAEAKRVLLEVRLAQGQNPVWGDSHRLEQVVRNLLSNSIKFTSAGGRIEVTLERRREGRVVDAPGDEDEIELVVRDTGKGIAPDFLPKVFDRFRQADSSTTREHGGLGLGLAIVRHLVEMHHGSVRAESAGDSKGSAFILRFPVAPQSWPRRAGWLDGSDRQSAEAADGPMLTGLRVLVVDDEPESCEPLRIALATRGADVQKAESAAAALDLLRSWRPDVLVSDIAMPGVDGYILMRSLRSLPAAQGGEIPAIALTAHAREEDRARALAAGYQVHLAKPIDPDELISIVADLAGRAANA